MKATKLPFQNHFRDVCEDKRLPNMASKKFRVKFDA